VDIYFPPAALGRPVSKDEGKLIVYLRFLALTAFLIAAREPPDAALK
jgi:hypothetical protein